MARTWLSVTVELIGSRGEELWPWPGRIFAVGPSHTFMDLANAREQRWLNRPAARSARERLEGTIHGTGAFRRFRDLVRDEGLAEQWDAFSTDRQLGRAREFLAESGIRVG